MGSRGNTRVQDRILEAANPGMPTCTISPLSEGGRANGHQDLQTLRKESNYSNRPIPHTGVPVQSVPGPQKRWLSKTSDNLVPTQPVCHLGTLQDGKHSPSQIPDPEGTGWQK